MNAFEEREYTSGFNLELWKKLLSYTRPYRRSIAGLALVMIMAAGIDGLFPFLTRYAIDSFVVPGSWDGLGRFALGYAGLVVWQAFNVWALIALAGHIELALVYDLRKLAFRRLQELSLSYFDRTPAGWIMARLTSDSQRLGEVISWGIVDILWGGVFMLTMAGFMFAMNLRLALVAVAVIPVLILVSGYFQKLILKNHRLIRKTNSKISGAYNEGITGAKTTKTLVREEANLREFSELTSSMRGHSVRAATLSAVYLPIVLTLGSIGTGLALWVGGEGVIEGVITYGTLVAFLTYTVQFFEPVRELARVLAELQAAQASAERVMSLIETEPEIQDGRDVVARYGDSFEPKRDAWEPCAGRIEFEHVGFQYAGGERVLEDFNLSVEPGRSIALVGETGSGKSTIVNLACRFYEPTEGRVLVDGVDYRERSLLWHHSQLGYVLQAPHLFSGSIRENIRYGRLDASDAEVEEAAKLVNADAFIRRMPAGYDTEVGEGGNLLSTGQKQLISFARALIANPAIFVFDEATSSVDTETEALIQKAIQRVLTGRTSFIIAHRLSTIKSADRILVIRKGRIIEDGSHTDLLRARGSYHALYTNQFRDRQVSPSSAR